MSNSNPNPDTANAGATAGGAPEIVRAFLNVDGTNDFADYDATKGDAHTSQLPVPGARVVGPVSGRLQREGKAKGIYKFQVGVREEHPADMFCFDTVCGKTAYVDKVPDRDGVLSTVWPVHQLAGTWGAEWIDGTEPSLFDAVFVKGTKNNVHPYSGASDENPEVIAYFKANGVTDIDVVGIVKRICEGMTILDLLNAGFRVRMIEDGSPDLPVPDFQYILDAINAHPNFSVATSDQVLA